MEGKVFVMISTGLVADYDLNYSQRRVQIARGLCLGVLYVC